MNHIMLLHRGLLGTGQALNENLEVFFVFLFVFMKSFHLCSCQQKRRQQKEVAWKCRDSQAG